MTGRPMVLKVGIFFCLLVLVACGIDPPSIVGVWTNANKQQLVVGQDLKGLLTQTPTCAPYLSISVARDPFDGYSVRFLADQRVYYPPAVKPLFRGEAFCSSKSSVPMCSFCQIVGNAMKCEAPEQEITGAGASVVHECEWERVPTSTTVRPRSPRCGSQAPQFTCVKTSTGS